MQDPRDNPIIYAPGAEIRNSPHGHGFDKTQDLLNHMARVQIEATIKERIAQDFLIMQAERMNKAGVKQIPYNRRALMCGMSETAHAGAVRQPVVYNRPAPSVH